MKKFRVILIGFLVAAVTGVFSGCATSSHDSYVLVNASGGLEKKQPSPTEDMSAIQKTGYYLGWYSLVSLYICAGSAVPLFPPIK